MFFALIIILCFVSFLFCRCCVLILMQPQTANIHLLSWCLHSLFYQFHFLKEISPGAFWPTPIWSSYLCTGYTALILELLFNIILGTCFTSRLFISCSLHIMSPSFFICSLILLHWNGYVGGKLFLRLDISEKIFILFEYLINNLMGYGILSCN